MSVQKVVESDGHGAFYGLIGFSLAVVLYPTYQWILPFFSLGLGADVDSTILRLGATSVFTGLLYSVPVDRFIDKVIEYKAGHESRTGRFRFFPTKDQNNELLRFISSVDYLTSTWRTPSWISLQDSCEHAISSAIKDPKVQREIWSLKNRSAVGLAFMLVGSSILGISIQIDYLSMAAILAGLILMAGPWTLKSSTRLPAIVRQVAAMRYAEDTFSKWRAFGNEKNHLSDMDRLTSDSERVESLISDGQWDRLNRLYTWMANLLERHNNIDYQVEERVYEIWARAIIDIVSANNKGEKTKDLTKRYLNALDVFRKCGRNKLPQWAEQLNAADLSDFPKFMKRPKAWKRVNPYYGFFHNEIMIVFESLTDEEMKVKWTNALVIPEASLSQSHLTTFFRFACMYTGPNIKDLAYEYFLNGTKYLPYEEVTIPFIDKLVNLYTDPASKASTKLRILNLLAWIAVKSDIKKEVRMHIIHHAEKNTDIRAVFERNTGADWKGELHAM